ncbi:4-oxalocrotonate tautomerase family protein [Streptomyces sp. NPDC056160]|uniref:tautomerase family protein n=1 Tax=Streptomyces sp. NPDC056160 TaxID=3345731 RepID=UPI0035DAB4CD
MSGSEPSPAPEAAGTPVPRTEPSGPAGRPLVTGARGDGLDPAQRRAVGAAKRRRDQGSQPCRSSPSSRVRATPNSSATWSSVTDAFVDAYHIPAETVQVWIHEVPADSWGAAGRLTADK